MIDCWGLFCCYGDDMVLFVMVVVVFFSFMPKFCNEYCLNLFQCHRRDEYGLIGFDDISHTDSYVKGY